MQEIAQQDAPHRGHPRFYELLREMERIHDDKNHDYAYSATDPLRNFRGSTDVGVEPFVGVMVRIGEKWMRACNLARMLQCDETHAVDDEPFPKTLIDIANYCLISIILYEETK